LLLRSKHLSALGLCCALATPVLAQQSEGVTLHFDPAATTIRYSAGNALKRIEGTFALKGGLVSFDPATGVAQGQILVDAATGHSKDKKFDARMQKNVLESDKYPEIFFHPEKSSGRLAEGKEEHLVLSGAFNMHGGDHPLKVDAVVTVHGDTATFRTEFDIPYVDWGMKEESTTFFHAKMVHVSVEGHAAVDGLSHGS
jgi:hypothetical protein